MNVQILISALAFVSISTGINALPEQAGKEASSALNLNKDQSLFIEHAPKGQGKQVRAALIHRQQLQEPSQQFIITSSDQALPAQANEVAKANTAPRTKASDLLDLSEAVVVEETLPSQTSLSTGTAEDSSQK